MTTTTDRKETEIGMIPQEWEVWSIWENCDLLTGFPFKWNMYDDKEWIRVLRWENVSLWFIRRDSDKKWKHDQTGLNKYFLQDLDLVVWMDWSRVWRNRAMIKQTDLPLLLAQRVARIRAEWNLDQKFLSYQILHEQFEKFVDKLKTGTSIPHISGDQIKSYPIILPPLNEQQAIATTLWSLDDKIELLREQNKTLESMGQAMFKSWFVDFDDVTEFEDSELGQIPKWWKVGKLGGLNLIVTDYVANWSFASLKKHVSKIYEEENYALFVRNTDLKNKFSTKRFVDKEAYEFLSKTKLIWGEVIISNVADVWSVYMCPKSEIPMTLWNNVIMIKWANLEYYLYYLFLSDFWQGLLSWITSWSAQLKFNKTDFKNLEIVIPNKDILHEFNIMIDWIYSDIEINLQQLNSLMQIRDNLLPRLMNGKVRII